MNPQIRDRVRELMGEPDKTKRHETFGTLIYLYSAERVFQIEEIPEFTEGLSEIIKRRSAAKKAVLTKRDGGPGLY